MRKKTDSIPGAGALLGLGLLLFSLVTFISFLSRWTRQKRMTTVNDTGYRLFDLLKAAGYPDNAAKFAVAQAGHESGNFESDIFKGNTNPFGIKFMGQREAQGERKGYALYTSLADSVKDHKRILKTYGTLVYLKISDYVKTLKKHGYFEAAEAEYLEACQWFYNLYFPEGWEKKHVPGAGGTW